MKAFILSITISLYFFSFSFAQQITLSGTVRDASSGETLIGASIKVKENASGVSANSYGFYSLSLAKGRYTIQVSSVGYTMQERAVELSGDLRLDFSLEPANQLETVEINAVSSREQIESPQMGVNKISIKEVNNVPVLFGERDVLKTIQLLPGVLSAGEGNSGFFVRGGTTDQNLILLDEAMVYNASHLMGFFSTFNSDAIKDVNLYKGGMPAQYGGRLASVLDVNMLDGNNQRFGMDGGIGLIASRLKVEGPIKKGKGSFMLSGRRTYADLFLKLSSDTSVNSSVLYFYDLNLKANYQLDQNNTLYLSGYFGKDVLGYANDFDFDWGNATGTLRWNHVFNSRLFSNTSFIYSDFKYNVGVYTDNNDLKINSRIQNLNLKQDFHYFSSSRSNLRFGLNLMRQEISPAGIDASEESDINSLRIENRQGYELAAYLSHEWKPSNRLSFIYGLRLNSFLLMGPGEFNTYDSEGDIIQTDIYGSGKLVKSYINPEPRFSVNYMLNENSSVKASYNRNTQNLHQLTNTTSSLPTDAWVLSSNNIKPQIADQGALGYYRNFNDDQYEFSAEVYYKDMQNQIDYKNAADLQANAHVEAELVYGVGKSYGLELFMKKRTGRLNGWVSYTLSRSKRRFDEINNGNWFAARQDRIHNIAIVGMYKFSDRWSFSGTFVYYTGNAVTFPSGKYSIGGKSTWYYTERNGYRMPDYHRLDLGATLESKPGKRFKSSWTFGLYNAYNRKNAYIIDFRENENDPNVTEAYKVALFGIIPSVTWNFKF
ncbi:MULTISPECIES: TonB-dependent receptor [Olivibacter]|uniref:Carboxypeptidase-like regulatory domain-containing protein n=1 Tax=Olivibacter oleidegradans TaxID=760123 RepID=A0ABV6HMG2_9SPHI|nr:MULTISPECIES: TonB-dependent receptor [Olivibacter]MCL4637860.1 TonB-dependent receptor [Olivibacter sp. UJ_SKK_5.1]MDM8176019.1 TonB-dependent receptor [Olivibacter sp. 47]MDX3914474.1 TonB-dependent receptor [Pseudosphingobacterium sp.]QEL02593.1 TonB-dependent receptor [Olivibacter sp. LS-1]